MRQAAVKYASSIHVLLANVDSVPDPQAVNTVQEHHGDEPDRLAGDSAPTGEDLAALLLRLLGEVQRDQKELATAAEIGYTRLNMWLTRKRGTSRVDPDELRRLAHALRAWGAKVTPKQVFEAAGRPVPGPSGDEREARLLRLYRQLPDDKQRDVVKYAEALLSVVRVS